MEAASHKDNRYVPFIAIRANNTTDIHEFYRGNGFYNDSRSGCYHIRLCCPGVIVQQKKICEDVDLG